MQQEIKSQSGARTKPIGPWHWWSTKDGRPKKYDLAELLDGNGETILTLYGGSGNDALGCKSTDRANARLIAAAPELLDALKIAREYVAASHGVLKHAMGPDNLVKPDLDLIDSAIAKVL